MKNSCWLTNLTAGSQVSSWRGKKLNQNWHRLSVSGSVWLYYLHYLSRRRSLCPRFELKNICWSYWTEDWWWCSGAPWCDGYISLTYDGRRKTVWHSDWTGSLWSREDDRPGGGHLEEEDHTWCQPGHRLLQISQRYPTRSYQAAGLTLWDCAPPIGECLYCDDIVTANPLTNIVSPPTGDLQQLQCNDVSVCLSTIFSNYWVLI